MGEILSITLIMPAIVMIGLGLGFALLKLQGGEE